MCLYFLALRKVYKTKTKKHLRVCKPSLLQVLPYTSASVTLHYCKYQFPHLQVQFRVGMIISPVFYQYASDGVHPQTVC